MILNIWKIRYLWALFVLLFFVSGVCFAGKEEKKAKYQKRARQYVEKNELK